MHGVALLVSVALAWGTVRAQDSTFEPYRGLYAYHGGTTIALVPERTPTGARLVAILAESKFPLRHIAQDRFVNGGGDTIPFQRDGKGRVTGFVERGVAFARVADTVPAEVAALTEPRAGRLLPLGYTAPRARGDGITAAALGAARDSATVRRTIGRVLDGTYPDVQSILLYRKGRLVLEEYFYGFNAGRAHQMRSATKSVVSLLAGVAIDRGMIAGDDAPVLPVLPYGPLAAYANPDPAKATLTLRNLLTMRSGLACDDWTDTSPGNEVKVYQSADWVKFVLDLPQRSAPGTDARYCSGGALVTSRIIERAVGTSLTAFAQQSLFGPLGIRPADVRWNVALDSSNAATFAQLHLRPRDMLKLGVLILDRGRWGAQQVVSKEWIERSTARVTSIGSRGYGYFWWHQDFDVEGPSGSSRVTALNASGNGGQKIYVIPALDAVVVFTGGLYNSDRSAPANDIMTYEILPMLLPAAPRAGTDAASIVRGVGHQTPELVTHPSLFGSPRERLLSPMR